MEGLSNEDDDFQAGTTTSLTAQVMRNGEVDVDEGQHP